MTLVPEKRLAELEDYRRMGTVFVDPMAVESMSPYSSVYPYSVTRIVTSGGEVLVQGDAQQVLEKMRAAYA